MPTKTVHSAKSWLSNPDVDRTAKILPWDSQEAGRVLSPVEVSAQYLQHFREAWESGQGRAAQRAGRRADGARVLRRRGARAHRQAAREAGIEKLTLLEEPAAAFYSWIANHLAQSQKRLFDGQTVLVCDVGGGTSDFTLIRVQREGDRVEFTRTAVGKHLLLGGDNLDLTLAWLVESKLGNRSRSASAARCGANAPRRKSGCWPIASCRRWRSPCSARVPSLIGGTLKTEILREEALELALEGFLPFCDRGEKPKDEKRSLFRELGLPYVSDPAVTRHSRRFWSTTGRAARRNSLQRRLLHPRILRDRVADVVEHWYGKRPEVLRIAISIWPSPWARRITPTCDPPAPECWSAADCRAPTTSASAASGGHVRTVCLAPRGSEEGAALEIDREDLQLVANSPSHSVSTARSLAPRTSSATWSNSMPNDPDLHLHAPLHAVIRFGKKAEERTDSREAGRAAHGSRARSKSGPIASQRTSLAAAVRTAQGSANAGAGSTGRSHQRRSAMTAARN